MSKTLTSPPAAEASSRAQSGGSSAGRMQIILNGEPRDLAQGVTLTDLLAEVGRDPRTVAVEYNGEILPRRDFADLDLADGDRLEIVHFVQGG